MAEPHRAGRGGICGLIAFLDEHYEAVESDFAARYGPADQLCNLWAGGLTYRRLGVLIRALPPESATRTTADVELAEFGPWSDEKYLLALIADRIGFGNWMFAQSKSSDPIPQPEPIPRPGVAPVIDLHAERKARRYLDRVRAGRGVATPL